MFHLAAIIKIFFCEMCISINIAMALNIRQMLPKYGNQVSNLSV